MGLRYEDLLAAQALSHRTLSRRLREQMGKTPDSRTVFFLHRLADAHLNAAVDLEAQERAYKK